MNSGLIRDTKQGLSSMSGRLEGARIVVAGAGIGGLAAALALARNGARVTVLERRTDPSEDGAGIQVGPNGARVLERLGVLESLAPLAARPRALRVHDGPTGQLLAELPLGDWIADRHGAPYIVLHRADLHRALRQAAEAMTTIDVGYSSEVVQVDDRGAEVALLGAEGVIAAGEAAVVADGAHSRLRWSGKSVRGPVPTGKAAARSVLAADAVPEGVAPDCVSIWLAPGAHVVAYPVRAGREMAVIVVRPDPEAHDGWGAPVAAQWAGEAVRALAGPLQELVAAAPGWRRWSLAYMADMPAMARGRVALLGDAAHPPLPFLAQGGVLALEDAVTLAGELARGRGDVALALRGYAVQREPRARRVIEASRRNGEIYHLGGAMRLARNLTLRTVPPRRLMAGYDWLYGWRSRD